MPFYFQRVSLENKNGITLSSDKKKKGAVYNFFLSYDEERVVIRRNQKTLRHWVPKGMHSDIYRLPTEVVTYAGTAVLVM